MEMYNAIIITEEEQVFLELDLQNEKVLIPLTDNKPNEIKNVFNKLIIKLKEGLFNFDLTETKNNLYYLISKEYINQLNNELKSIHKELVDFELVKE